MTVAVVDANILIDLIHINLLDPLFRMGIQIHTTLQIIDELNDLQQVSILEFAKIKKIKIHHLDGIHVPPIIGNNLRMSESDKSIFSLAIRMKALILSGDAVIRRYSELQGMEVHGILWLLDRFLDQSMITRNTAVNKLNDLMSWNQRMPMEACRNRLRDWTSE